MRNWLAYNILTGRAAVLTFFWCPVFREWFPRTSFARAIHTHNDVRCGCQLVPR